LGLIGEVLISPAFQSSPTASDAAMKIMNSGERVDNPGGQLFNSQWTAKDNKPVKTIFFYFNFQ
jgi:hypothetical protein